MFFIAIVSLLIGTGNNQNINPSPCTEIRIVNHLIKWGHDMTNHPRKIEAIIIHSSYNSLTSDSFNFNGVLREYKAIGVAPHYIIDRAGTIYRLVPDRAIAYHAGKSRLPDGRTNVNSLSIGIEIINTMSDSPTTAQYVSLANLVRCLKSEYPIKYVLGHSDIAPGRKTDPWNFDWKKFDAMLKQN
jgi:N-acetyl-anhydromuramyl-L-alanine amidase AmpD